MNNTLYTICLALSISQVAFSYELERGVILGSTGPFLYRTLAPKDISSRHSPLKLSFALIAEGGLDKDGSIEVGLFPINKLYFKHDTNGWVAYQAQKMHITTSYRYRFFPHLSLAAGVGTSYSMGDVHIHGYSNLEALAAAEESSVEKTAIYGFNVSAQWVMWKSDRQAYMVDFRYNLTLPTQEDEKLDHLSLLFGMKYHIRKPVRDD